MSDFEMLVLGLACAILFNHENIPHHGWKYIPGIYVTT